MCSTRRKCNCRKTSRHLNIIRESIEMRKSKCNRWSTLWTRKFICWRWMYQLVTIWLKNQIVRINQNLLSNCKLWWTRTWSLMSCTKGTWASKSLKMTNSKSKRRLSKRGSQVKSAILIAMKIIRLKHPWDKLSWNESKLMNELLIQIYVSPSKNNFWLRDTIWI